MLNDGALREGDTSGLQMGSVISIEGSKVHLELLGRDGRPDVRVTVGNFVRIRAGAALLVGIITTLSSSHDRNACPGPSPASIWSARSRSPGMFSTSRRGVTSFPAIGDAVDLLTPADLRVVYQVSAANTAGIGALYQDPETPACIKVTT